MLRRFGQENFVFVLCFCTVLVSVMGPMYLVAVAASRLPGSMCVSVEHARRSSACRCRLRTLADIGICISQTYP